MHERRLFDGMPTDRLASMTDDEIMAADRGTEEVLEIKNEFSKILGHDAGTPETVARMLKGNLPDIIKDAHPLILRELSKIQRPNRIHFYRTMVECALLHTNFEREELPGNVHDYDGGTPLRGELMRYVNSGDPRSVEPSVRDLIRYCKEYNLGRQVRNNLWAHMHPKPAHKQANAPRVEYALEATA